MYKPYNLERVVVQNNANIFQKNINDPYTTLVKIASIAIAVQPVVA